MVSYGVVRGEPQHGMAMEEGQDGMTPLSVTPELDGTLLSRP